jgi:N-acyl-D-amino-acid deacylase
VILIKNSTVIDGTGSPGAKKDILIKDDRIIAVGTFPNQQAEIVIDGMGMTTTPGFIDINTDSDHYLSLFTDSAQQDFLLQGVTTIFGGQCGSSLAPLIKGSLESIRKWGDTNLVNVNWHTMAEFLKTLDKLKLGVNFGTLVGHATVRRGILGETLRDLTAPEMDMMKAVIKQALDEGAFGVSTGLAYNHARNAPYTEVKMVAELAAKVGGVYATHVRNEREGLVSAVSEAISIAKELNVKTVISHFRSIVGFEDQFEDSLGLIENAGSNVHFDAYPFDYSIVPIYTLLPEWAQQGSLEQMQQLIADGHNQDELRTAFAKLRGDDIVIARAPGFDYLVGKTLAEYAKAQEITASAGLLALMRQTKLRAVVFKKNINFNETVKALSSPSAFIASNSPSLLEGRNVIENERAVKTFSKYLDIVRGNPSASLEAAVEKITAAPARLFGLKDRGIIREGAIADIAILSGSRAVHVLVRGNLAVRDGNFQGGLYGEILRRTSH